MTLFQTAMDAGSRCLHIRATLTLRTGYAYALTGSDILSYALSEGVSPGYMLLGSAVSAHGSITLSNPNGIWQDGGEKLGNRPLQGATVYVEIGAETPSGVVYEAGGSFIVSEIRLNEGEGSITLSGYDGLLHRFSGPFTDDLTYPCTIKSIFDAIVRKAGCVYTGTPACNEQVMIAKKPDWGKNCTLRTALAFAAAAMGCFVRLDRQGLLSLLPANPQTSERVLSPSRMQALSLTPGAFRFNRIRVIPRGAQADEYTECALDEALPEAADNLLTLSDNALFRPGAAENAALAQGLCTALAGLTLSPFEAELPGDPTLQIGDPLLITDLSGHVHLSMLFSQHLSFEQGLHAAIACEADFSGVLLSHAISANGILSSSALPEGMIVSRHLRAGSVDAEKISARAVTADHIASGAVTADKLAAGAVTADSITSGKLNTDRLIVGGTEFSIVRALNQLADSLSENDDRIEGGVLEDKSISANKVTDDFGAGLELSSNAAVLLLAGKLDGTHSHMELTESAINMVGGDINIATDDLDVRGMQDGEQIMSLDPNGLSADRVVVLKEFSAPNAVLKNLSSTIPWKGGIQASLDAAPKWLTEDVTLEVPAGTYQEEVEVRGFYGSCLKILFQPGATLAGHLNVRNCTHVILTAASAGDGFIYPLEGGAGTVNFYAVTRAEVSNMYISGYRGRTNADDGSDIALYFNSCHALVKGCCLEYANKGLSCNYSVVFAQDNFGGKKGTSPTTNANLKTGIYASSGSHVFLVGDYPMGGEDDYKTYRGVLSTFSLGSAVAGGMDNYSPNAITKSFGISKHCTYLYGVQRLRDDQSTQLSQGHYGGYTTDGLNWRTGAMWFKSATDALEGRQIISARLRLRRASGGNNTTASAVYLGYVPLTQSDYNTTLTPSFTKSKDNYPGAALMRYDEAEYDVTELMSAVQQGYALAVREPTKNYGEGAKNCSAAYAVFYGKGSSYEPLLTVTYH